MNKKNWLLGRIRRVFVGRVEIKRNEAYRQE